MTRASSTAAWRWLATIVAIAAAAFTMTATTAAPAHALGVPGAICTFASDAPNYIGWARISFRGCPEGGPQTMDCKGATAWRWTGAAWQAHALSECGGPRQVYVYPYAAGWSWIWSQQTGWLAVRSDIVLIQSGSIPGVLTASH